MPRFLGMHQEHDYTISQLAPQASGAVLQRPGSNYWQRRCPMCFRSEMKLIRSWAIRILSIRRGVGGTTPSPPIEARPIHHRLLMLVIGQMKQDDVTSRTVTPCDATDVDNDYYVDAHLILC